jgi:exodeoxyribonuclease V alpha subunit
MTLTTAPLPEQVLAEGFGIHVERWARQLGATADVAGAARVAASQLSLAIAEGHVCLALEALPPLPITLPDLPPADAKKSPGPAPQRPAGQATWRRALLASGVVGTPRSPAALPLILDDDDRLYLHRYFDYERRLAARLVRASRTPLEGAAHRPGIRQRLALLYAAGRSDEPADWQRLATALALRNRLTVISGGPGTGKTSTVVHLLACLITLDPACRIAMAAPTGKAAARLSEAVRQRAAHLPPEIRERLPDESFTVHRLLGVRPTGGGFVHHAGHPLAVDALVVDEASMLDLALATQLLEAVPDSARIVLLGDRDQLAAVESGAVFAELSADPSLTGACVADLAALTGTPAGQIRPPKATTTSALRDAVVWLTRNYRFASDSGIGRLARLVNAGDADAAVEWLRAGDDPDLRWLDDDADTPGPAAMGAIFDGYGPFLDAVAKDARDLRTISDAFARFRLLCAVRAGGRGVGALNEAIERHARSKLQALDIDPASPWYPGRPVLVQRNDPLLKLYNGDIGITLPDEAGQPMVHFAGPDGGFRAIAPVRLPRHETAFAMTVHKSQGSEFAEVLVMLPEHRSRVLSRELLYTAVTRARERVTLCADASALAAAIRRATTRHSGLLARLGDAAAG